MSRNPRARNPRAQNSQAQTAQRGQTPQQVEVKPVWAPPLGQPVPAEVTIDGTVQPTSLLTKVKLRVALHAHRKVRSILDGEYASLSTGRSMDFNDLRSYVPGDDVKDIAWRASVRKGELLIKRYVAERKHTVMLVASTSRSMAALVEPSVTKSDLMITIAGVIGYLAVRNTDYVGLVYGDRRQQHTLRPSTTEMALERLLVQIQEATTPAADLPDVPALLDQAIRSLRRRTIMVVLIDDIDLDPGVLDQLRRLRAQHELLVVSIADLSPAELTGAAADLLTGVTVPGFILGDEELRAEVAAADQQRRDRRRLQLEQLGIADEHVTRDEDAIAAVVSLLERHRHATR